MRISDWSSDVCSSDLVVENKPGAAGAIGAAYVAKAPADGYTLFGGTISTHAINASLYKNLRYDPVKDFEPVTLVATLPNVLLVDPRSEEHTSELQSLMRISYAVFCLKKKNIN